MHSVFCAGKKKIGQTCKGFFKDDRHLASQFSFISGGCPPLNANLQANMSNQIKNFDKYLLSVNQSVEYRKLMDDIDLTCATEFNGLTVYKDIQIIRQACDHFDKGDGKLLKLQSEVEQETVAECDASPHIVAVQVHKGFTFELWVEGDRLLSNLDMTSAFAAFFHLAFCFHLQYPKGGATVADILQRHAALYGDQSGTKTWSRKDTAEKKMQAYFCKLGKLM